MESTKNAKNLRNIIKIVSIVIPITVALLFKIKIEGLDFSFLPPFYATINALTAFFLILALVAIKRKNKALHQRFINLCMLLSVVFLLAYVAYHMTSDSTAYLGNYKMVYYPLLISHIILSVVIIPIVLYTYLFAYEGDFEKHKKWTKIAWPLWFYVAISGVLVYIMIKPYY